MTAHERAIGKAKSSAPATELVDIGEQARLAPPRRELVMSFASPIGLLVAWEIAGRLRYVDVRFFPVPSTIIAGMARMVESGELLEHVLDRPERSSVGFLVGGLPG